MEELSTADVLKQFASKITSSSVRDRLKIWNSLQSCVSKEEFPEAAVKGIFRLSLLTLSRYQDRKSRRLAEDLIVMLLKCRTEVASPQLVSILTEFGELSKQRSNNCSSNSFESLVALSWLCALIRVQYKTADAMKGSDFAKVIDIQFVLVHSALANSNIRIRRACHRVLQRTWKAVSGSVNAYVEILSTSELTVEKFALLSCLVKHLAGLRDQENIRKLVKPFVDAYVKLVISGKSRLPLFVVDTCRDIIRHVTHDEFKSMFLPAIERALLRNPETAIICVRDLISSVNIDLSSYSLEIGRHLANQCRSNEESYHSIATEACLHLAKQCSDASAVEVLAKHFLAVLNGSEGKLSGLSQKLSLVTCIANLSYCSVSGTSSIQTLSSSVVDMIITALQSEAHEATLVHEIMAMSVWCSKFTTSVPSKLVKWFSSALSLKTSTSAVRTAYFSCMISTFDGDTLLQGVELLPALIQSFEKTSSQQQLVTEAATLACLIAKLLTAESVPEVKLGVFWSFLLDTDKQTLSNDKFLSLATTEALQILLLLSEKLLVDHSSHLNEKQARMYYKIIIFTLTRKPYALRGVAQRKVRKMVSSLGGVQMALALIREFRQLLATQKETSVTIADDADTGEQVTKFVTPRILADTLAVITSMPKAEPADADQVAYETFIDAHHPLIVSHRQDAWTDLVFNLHLDAAVFVRKHINDFMTALKNSSTLSASQQNAVSTIARVAPDAALPPIVAHSLQVLSIPALKLVTRDECALMVWPEGELYDKSVIDASAEADGKNANVRRENKLYSYQEQMADLELRKELEKKRKATGKDEPKLTKKQQEAVQVQLQKEATTRAHLMQLDTQVAYVCSMLSSCLLGNATAVRCQLPVLLPPIVSLLSSPLAASRLCGIFIGMSEAAFESRNKYLGRLTAECSLRLIKPECHLSCDWTAEPLDSQFRRAVALLYDETVAPDAIGLLPAPSFTYCFQLLKLVVNRIKDKDESLSIKCLKIMSTHASKLRASKTVKGVDEFGPALLPREQMLQFCCNLVATTTGPVEQHAATVVLETARCASGNEAGCTRAEYNEICVLLNGLQSSATALREVSIQALALLQNVFPKIDEDRSKALDVIVRTWIAKFDAEDDTRQIAEKLWEKHPVPGYAELFPMMVSNTAHSESAIRLATAQALAAALQLHKSFMEKTLDSLLELYAEKNIVPPPVLDNFGRVISEAPPDLYPARCGVALALGQMAPLLSHKQVERLFEFFVKTSLGDRHSDVRAEMLKAAINVINEHGKDNVSTLLPMFEDFLQNAPHTASYDAIRQSVVILMGTLAKHLDVDSPKVKPIVARLIETLSTPSQQVQEAVANCLPPLVPAIKSDSSELARNLLSLLLDSDNYGERRGAAYGLAGLVKGLGILSLKQLDIMSTLTEALQDKKNPRHREGALFAFEMLCVMLGRLFEPYVVHLLPHLLMCFGDSNQYVREAADETAKAVMSKLSAHGVKLVLPSLLAALEEDSWRTKTGSVELLGAMAFCAPKQLSACLPSIVPKLIEVLTDSHLKVQKSGAQALKQIGSVIRNPEIQAVVPVLLEALQDPSQRTIVALRKLLDTKFVHFIDAPSLALVMPVVQRAFQDRAAETRKMAAQIIRNMYSLTDQKDLAPYLPTMIPGLKQSLLDPVPEVRTASAKALGAMVRGMGEKGFEELVPWLMQTLTSEQSSVDRSGAAQGLSEVVGSLGTDKLQSLMPDIIQTTNRTDITPYVRDGYIMMYIYLPSVFIDDFLPYVGPIIPSLLKALADEAEFVRDTALRAGQRLINMYSEKAIELLMPELENGLFDDNWRIRLSSIQLLGDLLYRISGVSGKMTTESASEDDNFGTETSQLAILSVLGTDRRDRVLAGLYMGRFDTALLVRQAALHVWKVIVAHTPKMLREIMSTLFQMLLSCLASQSYDKRQVAARTLGDIVRKLGEKVLPEIIPILERGLDSDDSDKRQGVCIGLSEIMSSTGRDHVIVFADSLIATVRRALCDPLPEVRESASKTFDTLHSNIGTRALDEIIPDLLKKLDDPKMSEYALDGLKQVMTVKSRVVLPYLVPQLTAPPVNTRALSFLSSVAGESLTRHLNKILAALMLALASKCGTDSEQQELEYCRSVVLSVVDEAGVRTIIDDLLAATSSVNATQRWAATTILYTYCEQTRADYSDYVPQLLRGIIHLSIDSDKRVLEAAWDCLNAITKKMDPADMLRYIADVRQSVRYAISDLKGADELPGFSLPKKGIAPILPIFREGILNGPPEVKEAAALGLGEVIRKTSPEALKSSVVNITGPLIRILGDRFSHSVKVAMLDTLGLLLGKCGPNLKPFLPQLQMTFTKALNDANRTVRLRSADALGKLVVIHTRVDPLFIELMATLKAADDSSIRDTTLQAIRLCLLGSPQRPTDKVQRDIVQLLEGLIGSTEDATRTVAAACLGTLCRSLEDDILVAVLNNDLLDVDDSRDWVVTHGRCIALSVALKDASARVLSTQNQPRIKKALVAFCSADRIPICSTGLRAVAYWLQQQVSRQSPIDTDLLGVLVKGMKHESNDIKQLTAQIVILVSKSSSTPLDASVLRVLVPMLVMGTKEKNAAVKSYSELALVSLLKLRQNDLTLETCVGALESGMKESLNEVVSKSLRKIAAQSETANDDDIDNTLLK